MTKGLFGNTPFPPSTTHNAMLGMAPIAPTYNAFMPPPLPTQVWVSGQYGGPYQFDLVRFTDLPHLNAPLIYIVTRCEAPPAGLELLGLTLGVSVPGSFLRFAYVGESSWCSERHRDHHLSLDFRMFGADIALVRVAADEAERCRIEKDIRWLYRPPLNRE